MKGIYRMKIEFRAGNLSGIFVANRQSVQAWLSVGCELYFGEVLGKGSNVGGKIGEGDIKLITEDSHAVEIFEKHNLQTGYNPFDYLPEEDDDE